MPFFLVVLICLLTIMPAQAAPIWVERNFVPASELIDERYLAHTAESAIIIDHSIWDNLLSRYVADNGTGIHLVSYNRFSDTDKQQLADYVDSLSGVDIKTLNRDEQLAFWINLYNALTVQLIVTSEPVESIRDLEEPWGTKLVTVGGLALTLNDIEHGIIRPVYKDNRIHYAVNCASIGCPNLALKAYTGASLDAMLNAAAAGYVNHRRGVTVNRRRVTASKIYGWYREDFGETEADVLNHMRQYANDDVRAALEGKTSIRKYVYDWDLNIAP